MFQCPYADYCSSLYRESQNNSFVRIFHASPNAPAVDVYINGNLSIKGLSYREFSNYLKVAPGDYKIKVFPSNKTDKAVLDTSVTVPERSILTVAVIGTLPNISLFPILEPVLPRIPTKAYVRFAHLSPNAPKVDIIIPAKGKIFTNIGYKEVTNYAALDAGNYIFNVNISGTDKRVLHAPNIRLLPNRFYTIYAVGLAGKTPPLQVVIPLDGNSYIRV